MKDPYQILHGLEAVNSPLPSSISDVSVILLQPKALIMKHAMTLTALLLVAAVALGQATGPTSPERTGKTRMEKHQKKVKQEHREIGNLHLFEKRSDPLRKPVLKTTGEMKQRLDNAVFEFWDDGSGQWVSDGKEAYHYFNGSVSMYVSYWWDDDTGTWVPEWKFESTYDEQMNETVYTEYEWDTDTSAWIPDWKEEYTYDPSGFETGNVSYEWDADAGAWIPVWKEEITNDANGNMTQYLGYEWDVDSGEWYLMEKGELLYNASGYPIQFNGYEWDEESGEWIRSMIQEATYDENWNVTLFTSHEWDADAGEWVIDWTYKSEYTYDASQRVTMNTDFEWDDTAEEWYADWKAEYEYDANGNPVLEVYSDLDEDSGDLLTTSKYEYTYELTRLFGDLITPPRDWFLPDMSQYIENQPLGHLIYWWDGEAESWENDTRGTYNYFEQEVGVEDHKEQVAARVYPNPVYENLEISVPADHLPVIFELFDMQGRLIITRELGHSASLNVEGLANGMYMYLLRGAKFHQTGKMIKE